MASDVTLDGGKTADYVMTVGFAAPLASEGSFQESFEKERSFMLSTNPVIPTIEEQIQRQLDYLDLDHKKEEKPASKRKDTLAKSQSLMTPSSDSKKNSESSLDLEATGPPIVTIGFDVRRSYPSPPPDKSVLMNIPSQANFEAPKLPVVAEEPKEQLTSQGEDLPTKPSPQPQSDSTPAPAPKEPEKSTESSPEPAPQPTLQPAPADNSSASNLKQSDPALNTSNPNKKSVKDFEMKDELGAGSFATVRKTVEIGSGRTWAAKILSKAHIIKFNKQKYVQTEKKILDALRHPNIIYLYCTFQDTANLYYIVELCPNGELQEQITKYGKLSNSCTQFYAAEIVNAIEYMHSKGIVHRDLKPENVLLDPGMHCKLNDFGTAKEIGNDPKARSNSFTGTAAYVCPELLNQQGSGKAADLWSLGATIYHMITGKAPFSGQTNYQIFQSVINRDFTFPSFVPNLAKDLIDRLMDMDPDKRLGVGPEGMTALKAHPFFKGIQWDKIHLQNPPKGDDISEPFENLKKSPSGTNTTTSSTTTVTSPVMSPMSTSPPSTDSNSNGKATLSPSASTGDKLRTTDFFSAVTSDQIVQFLSQKPTLLKDQKNLPWSKFVEEDELIIYSSLVYKKKGLFSKKRQLIFTDKPRFLFVDMEKSELKHILPFNSSVKITPKSSKKFVIQTNTETIYLEDNSGNAQMWAEATKKFLKEQRSTI